MRKIHLSILIVSIIAAVFFFGKDMTFASCGGSWFNSSCATTSPYNCTGGKCGLEGGLDSTKTAIGSQLSGDSITKYAQDIVVYLMTFVSLIAVIYIIWAGFQLMIGGGDEEKMKKARQIIIYVILGVIIMWLARPIVRWTIDMLAYDQIIPRAFAAYTESESDTFLEYKNKIKEGVSKMESEMLINKTVNIATIQNVKSLLQQGFDRLPDYGEAASVNKSSKQSVETYLDIAIQNPSNSNHVGNAITRVATFLDKVTIGSIKGEISANPEEGNAPLSVSFRADNVKDPSGTTPSDNNYIWWTRENGGYRRELSRGPSMSYVFTKEGTYTVFLDVISGSRNSKGKIDVLPLSISKQISVKPKLGDIVLLINGVNVSNMTTLKVSPAIGKMGIILDASASRAIGNGTITETTWDFGNGNTSTNRGGPIVERQIYANQGGYIVKLTMKTNNGQSFVKEIQLLVRDPAAIIKLDKETGNIGEDIGMSATSYFSDSKNTEFTWQIQDENGNKSIKSGEGMTFKHNFQTVGSYIITLTAKSPNGGIDTDSKIIKIESREPIINIDNIMPLGNEKPNTIVFDGTKSYDPDSNSRKNLTYQWKIDDERVILDNIENNGAKGTYTFSNKGSHKVSLTVTNTYGKIATLEKEFNVSSILSVNMLVLPKVGKRDIPITLIGQSANAEYFEWNMGDGSPVVSGNTRTIQHTYKQSGIYNAVLTVNRNNGSESNALSKKIYISDSDAPFAIIEPNNTSNSIIEENNVCDGNSAFVINRAEITTFNGANSVNTDGTTNGLTYTWKYFGKARTTPSISEKFNELGCFPIELTVRSTKNGASHTTKQYVKLNNQPPEITSITTTLDDTKKDSQKVIVRVQANGALDPDGVISSYIWYYTTESDPEPQNVQITQKNNIAFVLPNITEKYYFGVILEDNDGARMNTARSGQTPAPLIIDNANGNINLPLITLTVPKTVINIGEKLRFSVDVKTIIPGVNITNKSEYAWDFDGDGRIDEKSTTPTIEYAYKRSGDYNMKVRVTNNGVSNAKYQTIHVKNKLKAGVQSFRLPDGRIYLINSSEGVFNKANWEFGATVSESLTSMMIDASNTVMNGKLTISNGESDQSNVEIDLSKAESLTGDGLIYQSYPKSTNDTITVKNQNDPVMISMIGNDGTAYSIDDDILIDTNLDGVLDNDDDNKDHSSYTDGSLYTFNDLDSKNKRERKVRLAVIKDGTIVSSKIITIVLDYIAAVAENGVDLNGGGIPELSQGDKEKLEGLSKMIRELPDTDRIILMQRYNTLVENWSNPFDKAKSLIDIQEGVESGEMDTSTKAKISKIIDELLIGDAQVTDEVGIAAILIRDLIPKESPNHDILLEKLTEIESHPTLLDVNKKLGKEMLLLIETDTTIPDKYKGHIKNQLLIIINGGTNGAVGNTDTNTGPSDKPVVSSDNWILGFITGFVKIFLIIIGSVLVIGIIAFIFYRITRKGDSIGFQDFLIDAVFHGGSKPSTATQAPSTPPIKQEAPSIPVYQSPPAPPQTTQKIDPLVDYVVPVAPPVIPIADTTPMRSSYDALSMNTTGAVQPVEELIPDWLKVSEKIDSTTIQQDDVPPTGLMADILANAQAPDTPSIQQEPTEAKDSVPDWLKLPTNTDTAAVQQDDTMRNSDRVDPLSAIVSPKDPETTPEALPRAAAAEVISEAQSEDIHALFGQQSTTNRAVTPPPLEEEDSIPDWIKNTSLATGTQEEDTKNTILPPPSEEKLPDWLLNSLQNNDTSLLETTGMIENTIEIPVPALASTTIEKKPKEKKSPTVEKKPPAEVTKTENIPSWLK